MPYKSKSIILCKHKYIILIRSQPYLFKLVEHILFYPHKIYFSKIGCSTAPCFVKNFHSPCRFPVPSATSVPRVPRHRVGALLVRMPIDTQGEAAYLSAPMRSWIELS